jgi:fatty acid synthase
MIPKSETMQNKPPYIIGYGGRFPGCDDTQELWHNLSNKIDCVKPPKRYAAGFMDLPPRAGHLNNPDRFDAKHFKFNKDQVAKLCPQNRLLLECTEEAMLDARLDIAKMRGSKTGVYVGASSSDFHANVLNGNIDGYENVGGDMSMAANKISYHYDFRGPSCSYSTACSSSLVAFNEAYNCLRSGEIDYAIVAGASLHLRPTVSKSFAQYNMLSPTGTCHVFDKDADGYCRSEGIAVIILSRVHESGYAAVLASGVNHDGYTKQGITFPNGDAQIELVQATLKSGDLRPEDIEYVEAHGTGTTAGDGVETRTFGTVFGKKGVKIGSIKSNVGHGEVVSGINSVVKCLLAYEHKQIPPNLHYYDTPHEPIKNGTLRVVDELQPFDCGNSLIMNYGFGGSNACVILGNGGYKYKSPDCRFVRGFGNSECKPSLMMQAQPWNRTMYGMRTVLDTKSGEVIAKSVAKDEPRVAFVFTGRGCVRKNMGKELLKSNEIFRETITRLDGYIKNYDPSIELMKQFEEGQWADLRYRAPGITAFQIGLINMLRAQGIYPDYILGHSVGEFASAYCDQCITEEECILLVAQREAAMRKIKPDEIAVESKGDQPLPVGRHYTGYTWFVPESDLDKVRPYVSRIYPKDGIMCVVGQTEEEILPVIQSVDAKTCQISCFNCPSGLTISGTKGEIARVLDALDEDVFRRKLKTPTAFHNHNFIPESIKVDIKVDVKGRKMTKMLSTVDLKRNEISVDYFVDNMISPVKFYQAVNTLPSGTVMLEVGPNAILLGQAKRTRSDLLLVPMVKSLSDEQDLMEGVMNKLWLSNVNVFKNMKSLPENIQLPLDERRVDLWNHEEQYDLGLDSGDSSTKTVRYDLLGDDSYMLDHRINNSAIFPAAGHLYTAWGAIGHNNAVRFTNFKILQSVPIEDVDYVEFGVSMVETEPKNFEFNIFSSTGTLVSSGSARIIDGNGPQMAAPTEPKDFLSKFDFYNKPNRVGYNYATQFQKVRKRSLCGKYLFLDNVAHWPVYMDMLLQATIGDCTHLELPTSIESVTIWTPDITQADMWLSYNKNTDSVGNNSILIERCKTTIAPRPNKKERKDLWGTMFLPYGRNVFPDVSDSAPSLLCQILVDEYSAIKCFEIGSDMLEDVMPTLRPKLVKYTVASADFADETDKVKALKWEVSKPFPADQEPDLILSSWSISEGDLPKLYSALPNGGYLLMRGDVADNWCDLIENSKFEFVSSISTEKESTILCKKVVSQSKREVITNWQELKEGASQIYVNTDDLANPAGFVKAARHEGYDVTYAANNQYPANLDMTINVCRNGRFGTDVNVSLERQSTPGGEVKNMELVIENPGRLDTICFKTIPAGDIQIKYGCLNYKDLMIMVGKLQLPGLPIGFEFAGVDSNGQNVIGFGYKQGHYAKSCRSEDLDFLINVPDDMPLEDAATLPVVYATCYEALVVQANIQKGQTILIHSCTGGVGHAAVSIARHRGAIIYGTCSKGKREYATKELGIPPENLGNSRDESFYEMIKERTNGEGVDIVLNSLAGDKLLKSVNLVREFGHFCEIGKYDYQQGTKISMGLFKENLNFHLIDLSNYGRRPDKIAVLMDLMKEGIASGEVKPLPVKVYPVGEIRDAIDFMAKSRHIGKIVVSMEMEQDEEVDVVERYRTSGSHIITGGLGGFGLELANWLVDNGAETIVLTSRSGIRTGWQKKNVQEMRKRARVIIDTRSLNSQQDAFSMLCYLDNLQGVWHLAGVLRDGAISNMTQKNWDLVVNTKMQCIYLDQALEALQLEPQSFCMFSSVSNRFGNFGQTNYAYGNSICEEICYERFAKGKSATAIQWGVIGDVGMAANLVQSGGAVNEGLSEPLPIADCLEHMHSMLTSRTHCVFLCNREHVPEQKAGTTLSERILGMLGFTASDVSPKDTLEDLGLDSLQNARVHNMLLAAGKQSTSSMVKELTVAALLKYDEE